MPTEQEFVTYKEFVEGLDPTENPTATDKQVVCNETNGPRVVPASESALTDVATEADLKAGNYIRVKTPNGWIKMPAEIIPRLSSDYTKKNKDCINGLKFLESEIAVSATGKGLSRTDGTDVSLSNGQVSDYINITFGVVNVHYCNNANYGYGICFYDDDKKFICGYDASAVSGVLITGAWYYSVTMPTIPLGAVYMRIAGHTGLSNDKMSGKYNLCYVDDAVSVVESVDGVDFSSIAVTPYASGKSLSRTDGSEITLSYCQVSDFINIKFGIESIHFANNPGYNYGLCFYDKDKNFIKGVDATTAIHGGWYYSTTIPDVPVNAVYIRVSGISSLANGALSGKVKTLKVNVDDEIQSSITSVVGIKYTDYEFGPSLFGSLLNWDGGTSTSGSSQVTDFINISSGVKSIHYANHASYGPGVAFYDVNKKFISGANASDNSGTLITGAWYYSDTMPTIPDGAVYIRVNGNGGIPNAVPSVVSPQNVIENKGEQNIITNFIYVATTGDDTNGDGSESAPYATILKACSTIQGASYYNRYKVLVADGTYNDLELKYAGSTPTVTYEGVVVPRYTEIIGNVNNPSAVVLEWDGAYGYEEGVFNYDDYGIHKCLFHILDSSKICAIRGFTFNTKNCRYALHIEMSGNGYGVSWEVTDCIFNWGGVVNRMSTPTIGTGSGHYEHGLLQRCKICNASGVTDGFRNHDSAFTYTDDRYKQGADITIDSCDFGGGEQGNTVILFRSMFGDDAVDGFNIVRMTNVVGVSNFSYAISSPSTVCNWRAIVFACGIDLDKFKQDGFEN